MSSAMAHDKYAGEFPLPGGVEQYYETLVAILSAVRDDKMTPEKMNAWIRQRFETVRGDVAIAGYLGTLQKQGFWGSENGVCVLSKTSLDILEASETDPGKARKQVLDMKRQAVEGYEHVLQYLKDGLRSLDEVDRSLQQAMGASWQSQNQTMFRLNWLRSLGYVRKEGRSYELTSDGKAAVGATVELPPPVPSSPPVGDNPMLAEAKRLADKLEHLAVEGNGDAFEQALGKAFCFLGFDAQVIGGSGNPDVLLDAPLGKISYRVLLDAKSRSGGTVMQNDVNFESLRVQKEKTAAVYTAVVGPDFSSGNLEQWSEQKGVRLIRAEEVERLLLAHAVCPIPLDTYVTFFKGGGTTDDGILASLLAESENTLQMIQAARSVYKAVLDHQDSDASVDENALYFILNRAYSVDMVKAAVAFLQSDVIGAVGKTETGSLHTRLSPAALLHHLDRLKCMLGRP